MLSKTIRLYTLNSTVCQLYLSKTGEKEPGVWKTGKESLTYIQ